MNLPTNKGFALFVSIFIILAFSTVALLCFNLLTVQDDAAVRNLYFIRTYFLAEAARQLFLEYYAPWGDNFTDASQFPDLSVANGQAKTLGDGRFEIVYSNKQAPPTNSATVSFTGSLSLSATEDISRTFTQDFSSEIKTENTRVCDPDDPDQRDCISGDLRNFVLNVYNPSSADTIRLGGKHSRYTNCMTNGCPCGSLAGGSCGNNCATYRTFFESDGDVYIDNCTTEFRIGKIGTSTKSRDLYVKDGNITVLECARIYGTVYRYSGTLTCKEIMQKRLPEPCQCYVSDDPMGSNSCWNHISGCNNPDCSNGCCYSEEGDCVEIDCYNSDGGWTGLPKPLPSKPAIDNGYFNAELNLAENNPNYFSSTLSSSLTQKKYYRDGDLTINGDISGGPADIVVWGKITIQNVQVDEKINLISSDIIEIEGNSGGMAVVGGQYHASGSPCPTGQDCIQGLGGILYAENGFDINEEVRIKGWLLSPAFIHYNYLKNCQLPQAGYLKIWGIIYANQFVENQCHYFGGDKVSIFGSIFVDKPAEFVYGKLYVGLMLHLFEDGDNNSDLFLPMKLRGLYNITASNWQEQ